MTHELYHDFEQIEIRGWLVNVTAVFKLDVTGTGRNKLVDYIDHIIQNWTIKIVADEMRPDIPTGETPSLTEIFLAVRTDSQTLADWYEQEGR